MNPPSKPAEEKRVQLSPKLSEMCTCPGESYCRNQPTRTSPCLTGCDVVTLIETAGEPFEKEAACAAWGGPDEFGVDVGESVGVGVGVRVGVEVGVGESLGVGDGVGMDDAVGAGVGVGVGLGAGVCVAGCGPVKSGLRSPAPFPVLAEFRSDPTP